MSSSQFIAGLIGPLLFVVGLVMLFRQAFFVELTAQMSESLTVIFFAGVAALLSGIAIVRTHNIWSWDWRVLVTIFGWLAILGGLFRMIFPDTIRDIRDQIADNTTALVSGALISLGLGAYLSAQGFGLLT